MDIVKRGTNAKSIYDSEICKNLIKRKSELFDVCSCKTRLLCLCAVGNDGANEATS